MRNHGIMLGYQSVEDFYDANSVMIDADTLFPAGSIRLCSIKLFSDTKIDEALLDAASLTAHAGSILKELFSDVISGKENILSRVENFVYEDSMGLCGWINNKRILFGNRELMNSHNIEGIPTKTKESEFTENGKDALYLSVSGNLAAMFIIEITAGDSIKKSMKQLEKHDMAVIIKTIDPFITINRISELFGFTDELLKIIPTRMMKDFDAETRRTKRSVLLWHAPVNSLRLYSCCWEQSPLENRVGGSDPTVCFRSAGTRTCFSSLPARSVCRSFSLMAPYL